MIRTLVVVGLIAASSTRGVAFQQVDASQRSPTRLIPFSGILVGAAGADAVDGARTVTFALFDEAEGGTLLWTETQTISVDERGRYSAYLGAAAALPLEIFRTEQARWLEVTVDGRALPRTMLVAVPYALRAADAETLGGKPLSDFVLSDANGRRVRADGTTIDGPAVDGTGVPNQLAKWSTDTVLSSSIITESFDNRLGILAPDPTGGGAVDSRFTIRNPDNNTAIGILSPVNQRRFALNTNADGSWTLFDGGSITWNAGLRQFNGNLGIGTAPSPHKLTAQQTSTTAHAIRATGPATSGITLVAAAVDSPTNFGGVVAVLGYHGGANGTGVSGWSPGGTGVRGTSDTGFAGDFVGNARVTGSLSKGGGAFEIDHPLDPANKILRHSFVESPDMMNVYNGNAALDANGEAWVALPEWFEALNRDFRYQLTSIGRQANPYVAEEITGNRFKIAGGAPNGKVSWQVTGVRQDTWANANRIVVEEEKRSEDRGFYLHPKSRGLDGAALVPSIRKHVPVKQSR